MVHCCQVNNGTQARQSRTPPADPSWTGAPTLCCTSPRSHPFPPYPPFRGGALQSQCSRSPSRPHHPSRGGASPDQTSPSSCTKASSPNQQDGIPPGGELRVAAHQLAEEEEELEHELGEIGEEEQEGLLDQEEEEGSESQGQSDSKHKDNSQGDPAGLKISLGQQLAAKITTLGNQPYKHL
jgi:hypothetical protein